MPQYMLSGMMAYLLPKPWGRGRSYLRHGRSGTRRPAYSRRRCRTRAERQLHDHAIEPTAMLKANRVDRA
jgi:hypothetical protein